jgi:hypothetical protein
MNRPFTTFSRRRCCFSLITAIALVLSASPGIAQPKPVFLLHSGDRVVLVGDTLIEREQTYGYLEQRLTARFPEANVTFRNLGWSADTPAGESRASFDFDKPGRGFEMLKEEIAAVQPTVVIVGYGMASSFNGMAGLAEFKAQYNKLLDAIQDICTNKPVRFVLLSPIRHENLGLPLPDPTEHNIQLALYTSAIDEIARTKSHAFISLFTTCAIYRTRPPAPSPMTASILLGRLPSSPRGGGKD